MMTPEKQAELITELDALIAKYTDVPHEVCKIYTLRAVSTFLAGPTAQVSLARQREIFLNLVGQTFDVVALVGRRN